MIIKYLRKTLGSFIFFSVFLNFSCLHENKQRAENTVTTADSLILGAYYFDGWTEGSHHITESLKNDFRDREPIWGWVTSTQPIVDAQRLSIK